jgi:hypothetical protein
MAFIRDCLRGGASVPDVGRLSIFLSAKTAGRLGFFSGPVEGLGITSRLRLASSSLTVRANRFNSSSLKYNNEVPMSFGRIYWRAIGASAEPVERWVVDSLWGSIAKSSGAACEGRLRFNMGMIVPQFAIGGKGGAMDGNALIRVRSDSTVSKLSLPWWNGASSKHSPMPGNGVRSGTLDFGPTPSEARSHALSPLG